jgi:hypothetical protein
MASLQITINTASNDEHVPDIERFICTLKERTRCIYNALPFKKMPDRLVIEMVCASNFWLNSFPTAAGISDVLSPRAIVTGASIDFLRHCQLEYGAYVQTHEDHDNVYKLQPLLIFIVVSTVHLYDSRYSGMSTHCTVCYAVVVMKNYGYYEMSSVDILVIVAPTVAILRHFCNQDWKLQP